MYSGDPSVITRVGKDGKLEHLTSLEKDFQASILPKELFVKAGNYVFEDEIFDCSIPGIYRFSKPQVCNAQRIVLDKNEILNNLLFFSLLAGRGNLDNGSNLNKLKKEAGTRFLCLTCGPLAKFVMELAKGNGIKTRVVSTHTLESTNTYNNGHTLLECKTKDSNSWIAFDVDKKCVFKDCSGNLLDAFELCREIVSGNRVEVEFLSKLPSLDLTNFCEKSTGYNYQFLEMNIYGDTNGFNLLFKRLCNIPFFSLPEGFCFGCWDEKSRSIIESHYPTSKILNAEEFRSRFYECSS